MLPIAWRIPFLLAGPLGLVGLYIRLRLDDTPQFAELSKTQQVAKSPLREAVRTAWRPILQVIGLMIIFNIGYYVVYTFLPTYFIKTRHFTKTNAFVSITLASLVALVLILPLAALSDGRPLPQRESDEIFQSEADIRGGGNHRVAKRYS